MINWEKKAFHEAPVEIIDGDRGENYPAKSDFEDHGFCLFLNTSNVTTSGFDFSEKNFISKEKDQALKKGKLKRGDIVLTTRGTVGNVAFYSEDIPYDNIRINSGMVILRVQQNELNPYYLYLFLQSDLFKKQVMNQGSGSAQPQLPISSLKNILIPWTHLERQKYLASVFSVFDSKIRLNRLIKNELEELAKIIYDYWFVQFEFPNKNGKPYKSNGGKMVWDSDLKREIPQGWKSGRMSDIGSIIGGSTPPREIEDNFGQGVPWITPKDLSDNDQNTFISHGELNVTEKGVRAASLKILPKGSVLLSTRAPIGYMAIASNDLTTNQGFKSFVPKDYYSSEFIYLTVKKMLPAIIKNASGSTFVEISGSTLGGILVCLAPQNIIEDFCNQIRSIFFKHQVIEDENREILELRSWLLPMAMNGQIRFD